MGRPTQPSRPGYLLMGRVTYESGFLGKKGLERKEEISEGGI